MAIGPNPGAGEGEGAAFPATAPQQPAPQQPPPPPESVPRPVWWRRIGLRRAHRRQDLLFLLVAALWIAFDQISKVILRESLARGDHWELASFFRVSHVVNEGAAFGLFGDAGAWLVISAVVAIVVIIGYYVMASVQHWLLRSGLALILGGAVGNLLDRLYQGEVTDFINFDHFPAFNVADAGINIGIAAILLYLVLIDARRPAAQR